MENLMEQTPRFSNDGEQVHKHIMKGPLKLKLKYMMDSMERHHDDEENTSTEDDQQSRESPKAHSTPRVEEPTSSIPLPRSALQLQPEEIPLKSRFRGVFRCGKKWKVSLFILVR